MTAATMTVEGVCEVAASRNSVPVRLAYELYGTGEERVLLIMGLNAARDAWKPQAKYLAEHGYQACIFDNRGVGRSDAPSGYYTTKEMACDAAELLEHLRWTSGTHIVGASMGGMIALELAHAQPQLIKSLFLTSTNAGGLPPLKAVGSLPRMLMTSDASRRIELQCELLFPREWLDMPSKQDPSRRNADIAADMLKQNIINVPPQPMSGVFGQMSAALFHSVSRERLAKIASFNIPTLVCTGTDDNMVKPENSNYLAEHLRARLEIFDKCGHVVTIQEPERYNSLLIEHFSGAHSRVQAAVSSGSGA